MSSSNYENVVVRAYELVQRSCWLAENIKLMILPTLLFNIFDHALLDSILAHLSSSQSQSLAETVAACPFMASWVLNPRPAFVYAAMKRSTNKNLGWVQSRLLKWIELSNLIEIANLIAGSATEYLSVYSNLLKRSPYEVIFQLCNVDVIG